MSERDQYPDWCWCQYGHSAPGRSLSAEQSPCGQEERGSDSERAWPTHHTTPAPPHTTTTTAATAATQAQCSLQSHPPTTESKYEPFHLTLCLLLLSHSSLSLSCAELSKLKLTIRSVSTFHPKHSQKMLERVHNYHADTHTASVYSVGLDRLPFIL